MRSNNDSKRINKNKLKQFIMRNKDLFWSISDKDKKKLSLDSIIETILNYGDEDNVKELFEIIGTKKVAEVFFKDISRKRVNYYPRTVNFFKFPFKIEHPVKFDSIITLPKLLDLAAMKAYAIGRRAKWNMNLNMRLNS